MVSDPDIDGLAPLEAILTKQPTVVPRELAPHPEPWQSVPDATPHHTPLTRMRIRHQMAARLIAEGLSPRAASVGSGYAPDYIRVHLMQDPAFVELVNFYQSNKAALFTECYMRIGMLGMTGVERLQERLEDDKIAGPHGEMSTKTLADLTMDALDRSVAPARNVARTDAGTGGAASIVMNLNFAEPPRTTLDLSPDPVHAQKATDSRTPNEGLPDAETSRSHNAITCDTREPDASDPDYAG